MADMKRIGVFGHYGNKNLGDEAIILAVIQNLRKRIPDVIINGFSINPEDTSARYGIDSYPIRRISSTTVIKTSNPDRDNIQTEDMIANEVSQKGIISKIKNKIKRIPILLLVVKIIQRIFFSISGLFAELKFLFISYHRLKRIDVLMITGSNQFLDNFGGSWGFPYTLLKWSILAKATGVKLYYVCLGAGPISRGLSKFFVRWAPFFSEYISFRDISSERLLQKIGYKGETYVYPDLAYSLDINNNSVVTLPTKAQNSDLPVIGINPMPLYDSRYWCEKNDSKYNVYLMKMVDFTNRLLNRGFPFCFLATQEKDNNVIVDILKALEERSKKNMPFDEYVMKNETVDELMANIAAVDIVLATRFHATVLSSLSEKPILGVCYHRKNKELLFDLGQGNYAVELDSFTVDDLWTRFESLVQNKENEKEKIKTIVIEYRNMLSQQYDLLFGK